MRFFFYGTLLDDELRRVVFGHEVALAPATLSGWRRLQATGKHFPIIAADPGGSVEGGVTPALGAGDVARLRHYEGDDNYGMREVEVRDHGGSRIAARIFVPRKGEFVGDGPWDLGEWQRVHRAAVLGRLRGFDWPDA
jgi:ADP-ribose pyrophosphatase